MTHHNVLNQYDEWIKVQVHNEPLESDDLKDPKTGQWSPCFSPMSRESYKPHYQLVTYTHNDEDFSYFKAQFFVEDAEYDCFIVEVVGSSDGTCETHLHNSHDSLLASSALIELGHVVEEIETVIAQLSAENKLIKKG